MTNGVSLIVIRLELVDWSKEPDLFYCASDFKLLMEKPDEADRQKYAKTEEIRGCRQIDELEIETLTFNEDFGVSEDSNRAKSQQENGDSSTAPSSEPEVIHKSSDFRSSAEGDESGEGCSYVSAVTGKSPTPRSMSANSHGSNYRQSPEMVTDGTSLKRSRPKSATPKLQSTVDFYCGNPSVERVQGILHLFKDNKKISLDEDTSRSELICMLSVPAAFTLHDLLLFTDHVYQGVEYMKIIRDLSPNHYMVLIKFKCQKLADEFYSNYNNTPFNSIEPDVCHLVYVARVDFLKESEGGAVPIPGLVELPSCPVCLERMDESVDGILTILCNHAFHGNCLKKWGDTSCPVCRYSQTPEQTGENFCFECNSTESLWICLICGQVGCGRYVDGHAYQHFARTNHTYAMQLSNGRVWDYVGDNYVHRLIQNKEDGKLVEMDERGQRVTGEKMDSLNLERRYFEEKLTAMELEFTEKLAKSEAVFKTVMDTKSSEDLDGQTLLKNKEHAEKKCEQLSTQLRKVLKSLQEEQALNKSLLSNQQHWQNIIQKLEDSKMKQEQELRDTQEQLRDITFHLEARDKIAENSAIDQQELAEGQISVGAATAGQSQHSRRSRKKR